MFEAQITDNKGFVTPTCFENDDLTVSRLKEMIGSQNSGDDNVQIFIINVNQDRVQLSDDQKVLEVSKDNAIHWDTGEDPDMKDQHHGEFIMTQNTAIEQASQRNAIAFEPAAQRAKATVTENHAKNGAKQVNAITNVAAPLKDIFTPDKKESCVIL